MCIYLFAIPSNKLGWSSALNLSNWMKLDSTSFWLPRKARPCLAKNLKIIWSISLADSLSRLWLLLINSPMHVSLVDFGTDSTASQCVLEDWCFLKDTVASFQLLNPLIIYNKHFVNIIAHVMYSWIVVGLDFIKLKCSDTSMAEDNILRFIIVKKWPIIEPLALKATVHWLFLTKTAFWKLQWKWLVRFSRQIRQFILLETHSVT